MKTYEVLEVMFFARLLYYYLSGHYYSSLMRESTR